MLEFSYRACDSLARFKTTDRQISYSIITLNSVQLEPGKIKKNLVNMRTMQVFTETVTFVVPCRAMQYGSTHPKLTVFIHIQLQKSSQIHSLANEITIQSLSNCNSCVQSYYSILKAGQSLQEIKLVTETLFM